MAGPVFIRGELRFQPYGNFAAHRALLVSEVLASAQFHRSNRNKRRIECVPSHRKQRIGAHSTRHTFQRPALPTYDQLSRRVRPIDFTSLARHSYNLVTSAQIRDTVRVYFAADFAYHRPTSHNFLE